MDSYLSIAEKVLADAAMPLNAKEILRRAYLFDLVPSHLHGKTQHKTLQARISSNVRAFGDASPFYRVEPGVFFLNSLKHLPHLSEKQRDGFNTRPRYRELNRKPILTVFQSAIQRFVSGDNKTLPADKLPDLFCFENVAYRLPSALKSSEDYKVWAFVVVKKDSRVLSYRHGSYRENRDGFLQKRTIGFSTLLNADDVTFFEQDDRGLITAGLRSVYADLGVPIRTVDMVAERNSANLEFIDVFDPDKKTNDLVCVVTYSCPEWLEPMKRRLAINDLDWLSVTHQPNNIDDFDDWSKIIIPKLFLNYKDTALIA